MDYVDLIKWENENISEPSLTKALKGSLNDIIDNETVLLDFPALPQRLTGVLNLGEMDLSDPGFLLIKKFPKFEKKLTF